MRRTRLTGVEPYEQLSNFYVKNVAYALIIATRPQTLYGLADSPIDPARSCSTTATVPASPGSLSKPSTATTTGPTGKALRSLGTAAALLGRNSSRLLVPAQIAEDNMLPAPRTSYEGG